MDRFGGLNPTWQNTLGGNGNQRAMEEVPATTSRENENFDHVATSDEQENRRNRGHESSSSSRRGPHSRLTPHQIEELENYFKDNPHPTERQRAIIGRKLNIEVNKVKFWFQNRRTQMKTQLERLDNAILKQENETLRLENMAMREALRTSICIKCGKQAVADHLPNRDVEDNKLKIENARLRDELTQINTTVQQLLSSSSTTSTAQNVIVEGGLIGRPNNSGLNPIDGYLELALKAADELMRLGSVNAPLWERNTEGGGEILNFYEYIRAFPPLLCPKPPRFASEASRASAMVSMPSLALVETLLDANRWREMFAGLIGSSTTMEVISSGTGDSRNGVLQIMNAEIQVVSPLVPVRVLNFIRFSQQQAEGVWVVVDLSVDDRAEGAITRRLPSGCILHDMPNGFSRVTWIEHTEYDESLVHHQYRRLLRSGMGLGAQKWICALLRHCDCSRVMSAPTTTHMLTPNMRMSLKGLAQRMTGLFCAGVCLTGGQQWDLVPQAAPGSAWIMTRKSLNDLGELSGTIVSATASECIPATHRHLFDLLLNKDLRCVWDMFCHGNTVGNMIHFPLAQDETSPNSISILSSNTMADENSIMVLQETWSDMTGSLIVYASKDYPTLSTLITGEDHVSSVALLPTGLCIVPGYGELGAPAGGGHEHGSMVTVGFHVLLQNVVTSNLPVETISAVNDLMSRTIRGIKDIVRSGQQ